MDNEIKSLSVNEVCNPVELPNDRKAVGSRWVYRTKRSPNGTVKWYKACLVAQRYSQHYGQDYDETSPVVRFKSLRMIIALAVQKI